ncbi:MAG: hydrogenase maturation nickel metallochaperone HypA [Bacteroidota bacterium]
MHEMSLATEVYRLCRSRAAGGRIERVKVAVGELSAVEPELLRYAWEAVTSGGADVGAVLEIDWREAAQVCASCGARAARVAGGWLAACPACGGALRIEGGRELDVLELRHAPAVPR